MKNFQARLLLAHKKIKIFVLDTLFPKQCLGCQTLDVWLCKKCQQKIKLRTEQVCPVCEKVTTPAGQTCFACKKHSPLDGLLVATSYQEKLVAHAVHFFKYRFIEKLSQPLAQMLSNSMLENEFPLPEIILPIPLHPRRLRWRGFNQSQLLAKHLAMMLLPNLDLPMFEDLLIRQRYTQPQMKIKAWHQRSQNIQGAFLVAKPASIKGRTILLVDDIATTGSTIFECARVLKKAGAKKVFATVLARQEFQLKSKSPTIP